MTAAEFFQTLRSEGQLREFVAVESDSGRVEQAGDCPFPVEFVLRFDLPVSQHSTGKWSLVRAMNVLRGYSRTVAGEAWETWSTALAPGGRLIEGSTDDGGHVAVIAEVDHQQVVRRLVFLTDFQRGFAPRMFRDWLPRRWRRGGHGCAAVLEFIDAWQARFERCRSVGDDPRESFRKVGEAMQCSWEINETMGVFEWRPRENCV